VNAPGTLGIVVCEPVAPFGVVVDVDVVDVDVTTDGAGIDETTDATTMSTTSAPPRPSRSVQIATRGPPRDVGRVGRPAPSGLASCIVIGPILARREEFGRSGTSEPPGRAPPYGADTDVHQAARGDSRSIAPSGDPGVSLVDRGARAGTDLG
jgi:hypothetical protein